MALKLEQKKAIVAQVAEVANSALSVVAADYRGLTVSEMTALRVEARKQGIYLRIVRNTLAKKALMNTPYECLNDSLVGPVILAFAKDEPGAAARLVRDFAKTNEKLKARALSLNGQLYGGQHLEAVAKLPNRQEALTRLVTVMQAPISKFVRTMAEPQAKFVRLLAAIRDQKK